MKSILSYCLRREDKSVGRSLCVHRLAEFV